MSLRQSSTRPPPAPRSKATMAEAPPPPRPVRTALRAKGIGHAFRNNAGGEVHAIGDVTFEVAKGEIVVIVGPSGCGKSTLLGFIAGLDKPNQGQVDIGGKPVAGPGRDRILMFQEGALFPWLDAQSNVEFGLKGHVPRRERRQKVRDILAKVGLAEFASAHVHQLSGGMKQRVALARARAMEPDILLMDEPFAALDAQTRDAMLDLVQRVCKDSGQTTVFVTHNVREAACLGDRVLVLSHRPSTVKAVFEVEAPRPRHIEDKPVMATARQIKEALVEELEWTET